MAVKPILSLLFSLLLLCLITFKVNAEEGTVLFDRELGIDNTVDPATRHIEELNESLDNILPSDEELSEDESEETPEPAESEAEDSSTSNNNTQAIDDAAPTSIDEFSEPLDNILPSDIELSEDESEETPESAELETEDNSTSNNTQAIDNAAPTSIDEFNKPLDNILPSDKELSKDESEETPEPTTSKSKENFILIDKSQGIDNTVDPATIHVNELNKSLENILPSDEELTENELKETPDPTASEIEDTSIPDDKTQAIDNTATPVSIPTDESSKPLDNILPSDEAIAEDEAGFEKPVAPIQTGTEKTFILIDKSKGIDNIEELLAPPKQETAEDNNIETSSPDTDVTPEKPVPTAPTPVVTSPAETEAITPLVEKPELLPATEEDSTTIETTAEQDSTQKETLTGIWIPQDSDLRILEIRVDTYVFEDVIGAYQYKDIVLIPLSALSSILDIAIKVKIDFAEGFIIKEENTFSLDTLRNEVILKGIAKPYNNELVKILDNDIFIESNLLSKWLGMEIDIDLFSSRAVIRSDIKLPFLARLDRERRIAKALARTSMTEQHYPRHHEAYENYTPPFIDQTLRVAQRFSDAGDVTTFNSITYATADLLQHESTWFLTMDDQNGINDFRVTFGRTDPDGGLLGPINANEYKFGHITEPRIGLINSTGDLNYGVSASSHPIGQQSEYDRHRFIGELLPGWEVELYQNNALIGYQQTAVNGQYDFKDIPLLFGNNHFRLVFYGPKGELREESKNFQLTHALTQQGKHYYKVSTITDDDGEQRTVAQFDYGINKNISGTFNLVSIPLNESNTIVQHDYLGAGVISYWNALLASATIVDDSTGGSAVEIDLQTRIDETVIGFNDIHLSNFFSEEFLPSTAEITRRSKLSINTAIPPSFLPRIPVTFGFKRDEYAAGGELFEITNQLSMSTHGVAITNQITHQQVTDQQATSNGNLQISTNIDRVRLRGTIGYILKPENEVSNIALTLDPGQYEDYRFSFGINRSIQQNLTEISATANKVSGKYGLSYGIRYNNENEINLDLNFSIAFGYEPRRNSWHQDSGNLANQGSVSAHFFMDTNKDGIFNEGDTPIEDIGVRVNNGYNKERSDEDGILFLTGLPAHNPTNIIIAPGTLSDPLWTPALDGVRVIPRPGHAIEIDFPIFTTGEIDGTVELVKNGRQFGVGNVTVELVDQNNHVISSTETAYDGFYILSHIPMGEYSVRISKRQLDKLGLTSPNEERITINGDEPFINGVDFILNQTKTN